MPPNFSGMYRLLNNKIYWIAALILVSITSFVLLTKDKPVDFSTQVKPIINKHCITCHGGVKAKGGFSLLFREEALAKTKDSVYAIIPGDPDHSELMRRITLTNPEDRMPYKHEPLSKEEIDIFRRWIKQGAPWGDNWSYVPLKPVEIPQPKKFFGLMDDKSSWAKNPVDNFIEQKLKEQKLQPSPQADKAALLRRVSLDIIGMQPSDSVAQKFLNDSSNHAYEELVDSLLCSPHFGEKWTSLWLDLARYADTKGYERDDSRNIWQYRDWLIHAFNDDMPYDSFLIKQIAGDLLPNAADEDFIATAFNRNTMTNDEGGTENEEFRTAAVMDRVSTTWNAFMGTTFGCVQCHSHPYDPFKHEDYYKFLAFFNDTRDEDSYGDYPLLRKFNDTLQNGVDSLMQWMKKNTSPQQTKEAYTFLKTWQPAYNSLLCDSFTNSELIDTKWAGFRNNSTCRLKNVELTGKDLLILRYATWANGGTLKIFADKPNGDLLGTYTFGKKTEQWDFKPILIKPTNGFHNLYFTYTNSNLKTPVDNGLQFDWLYFTETFPGKDKPDYEQMKKIYWKLLTVYVPKTTPVMMDNPSYMHRTSYIFERGNWLVHGDKVEPAVPASLNTFPAAAPYNRLGLAEWMVAKQNPLTARTMVNRVWEQLFGTGLAETLEDLGTQGIPPTHEDLLNWLSFQFMNDYRWSIKALIKTMVMSATYQQSSKLTPELEQKDPGNKYYARGPRVRLSGEQVRDQALCIAGIMSNKMYGPGVMPYQPEGIWLSPWNGASWVQSKGEDQYRRAVYTYWKRSAAYPSMLTFDGVSREVCTARRIRTNTPLQALTTLNDSAFIDVARNFAQLMKSKAGSNTAEQIKTGFKLATYHDIDNKSLQALMNLYDAALNQFKNDADKTCEMLGGMNKNTNAENAALTVVANAILNLDEVVTKN